MPIIDIASSAARSILRYDNVALVSSVLPQKLQGHVANTNPPACASRFPDKQAVVESASPTHSIRSPQGPLFLLAPCNVNLILPKQSSLAPLFGHPTRNSKGGIPIPAPLRLWHDCFYTASSVTMTIVITLYLYLIHFMCLIFNASLFMQLGPVLNLAKKRHPFIIIIFQNTQ